MRNSLTESRLAGLQFRIPVLLHRYAIEQVAIRGFPHAIDRKIPGVLATGDLRLLPSTITVKGFVGGGAASDYRACIRHSRL